MPIERISAATSAHHIFGPAPAARPARSASEMMRSSVASTAARLSVIRIELNSSIRAATASIRSEDCLSRQYWSAMPNTVPVQIAK